MLATLKSRQIGLPKCRAIRTQSSPLPAATNASAASDRFCFSSVIVWLPTNIRSIGKAIFVM